MNDITAGAESTQPEDRTMTEQVAMMRSHLSTGIVTKNHAAMLAGFQSTTSSWRAEQLVDNAPHWAEKVDKGEMKLYAAFNQAEKEGLVQRKRAIVGGRPKKGSKPPAQKRIDPPQIRLTNLPTDEELGTPPPDAPWSERSAWREKMGSKVVLYLPQIRRLMNDKLTVEHVANTVRQLARRDDLPSLQQLQECLERLSAHQHDPNASRPEEQVDYAKVGREAQRQIVESLDAAIAKLEAYRAMVPRRVLQEAEE